MRKSVTNADGNSDCHGDSRCQRNTDGNGNCDRNSDCHTHAHRVANTKDYANSQAASDSSASALTFANSDIVDHQQVQPGSKDPGCAFLGNGPLLATPKAFASRAILSTLWSLR